MKKISFQEKKQRCLCLSLDSDFIQRKVLYPSTFTYFRLISAETVEQSGETLPLLITRLRNLLFANGNLLDGRFVRWVHLNHTFIFVDSVIIVLSLLQRLTNNRIERRTFIRWLYLSFTIQRLHIIRVLLQRLLAVLDAFGCLVLL